MGLTHLLALDASSQACSVAVWSGEPNSQGKIIHRWALVPRQQTQKLLPMVREVVAEAGISLGDIDAFAYGHGPGSFTGVRVAAGMVQGLAFGVGKPLLGLSTLECMALQAFQQHGQDHVVAALDARMGEVYTASYVLKASEHTVKVSLLDEERVIAPANITLPSGKFFGMGTGFQLIEQFPQEVQSQLTGYDAEAEPDAKALVQLAIPRFFAGEAASPDQALPVYLRNNVASKSSRSPLE